MNETTLSRRAMIKSTVAAAALATTQYPLSVFGGPAAEEGEVLIPFLDPQLTSRKQTRWQDLTEWITKNENLYVVSHYNTPVLRAEGHTLEVSGLVRKPVTLSLADLRKRKRKTITATLECGGNGLGPGFMGAIGNVRWTGTPLRDLLEDCAPMKRGIEVVFFGADEKVEKIRDNDYPQNFARSLHLNDALRDEVSTE